MLGLVCPNRQWALWTADECSALIDLMPAALCIIGFPQSPVLRAKIEQEASLWEQLGKPKIILRPYADGIITFNALDWSFECYILLQKYRAVGMDCELVCGNEFQIEGGGEDWQRQIDWLRAFATDFRMRSPNTVLHLPALSPIGNYRQGWQAYSDAGLAYRFDTMNMHAYSEAQLQDAAVLQGMFPALPIICTEVNQMAPSFYVPKLESLGVDESYWFILSGTEDQRPYWLMGSGYYADFKATGQGNTSPETLPATGGLPGASHDETVGGNMLKDKFPGEFAAWIAAGGDEEEAFRFYLMGMGKIAATQDFLEAMADNLASHAKELAIGISRLPFE